jgi:hypothetical protein
MLYHHINVRFLCLKVCRLNELLLHPLSEILCRDNRFAELTFNIIVERYLIVISYIFSEKDYRFIYELIFIFPTKRIILMHIARIAY